MTFRTRFNKFANSILLNTDSYKVSMRPQYPFGTEFVSSYIAPRGGKYDKVQMQGVQDLAQYIASIRITREEIDYAERIWALHGEPFDRAMWDYIADKLDGILPLRISAVPEGFLVNNQNILCVIENTDKFCWSLTTWIETPALRAIWYPTTVGTTSYYIKQEILAYLEKSGDPTSIGFKLHDFGARGVSSLESARIGGAAHLANFLGTDTMSAIIHIMDVYGDDVSGYSIPAAEHSTITSWGRAGEVEAYRNMLKQFAKPGAILAVVSDSYDIYNACKMWGTELKDEVIASGATVVIRPDSGDPVEVLPKMFNILGEKCGFTRNAKGYKVLNNVRIIWGDGINSVSLSSILRCVVDVGGWSADNIAFGMGGGLLQQCDRDTLKFAMKCSAIGIREQCRDLINTGENATRLVWHDVYKDPITDSGKTSFKGRVKLWTNGCGDYETSVNPPRGWADRGWKDAMVVYYENGELPFSQTFAQVRENTTKQQW